MNETKSIMNYKNTRMNDTHYKAYKHTIMTEKETLMTERATLLTTDKSKTLECIDALMIPKDKSL